MEEIRNAIIHQAASEIKVGVGKKRDAFKAPSGGPSAKKAATLQQGSSETSAIGRAQMAAVAGGKTMPGVGRGRGSIMPTGGGWFVGSSGCSSSSDDQEGSVGSWCSSSSNSQEGSVGDRGILPSRRIPLPSSAPSEAELNALLKKCPPFTGRVVPRVTSWVHGCNFDDTFGENRIRSLLDSELIVANERIAIELKERKHTSTSDLEAAESFRLYCIDASQRINAKNARIEELERRLKEHMNEITTVKNENETLKINHRKLEDVKRERDNAFDCKEKLAFALDRVISEKKDAIKTAAALKLEISGLKQEIEQKDQQYKNDLFGRMEPHVTSAYIAGFKKCARTYGIDIRDVDLPLVPAECNPPMADVAEGGLMEEVNRGADVMNIVETPDLNVVPIMPWVSTPTLVQPLHPNMEVGVSSNAEEARGSRQTGQIEIVVNTVD